MVHLERSLNGLLNYRAARLSRLATLHSTLWQPLNCIAKMAELEKWSNATVSAWFSISIFFLCKQEMKRRRGREREKKSQQKRKRTEQTSKARKGAEREEKKTWRETQQRSRPRPRWDEESEQRTWAGGWGREPTSTRQRRRKRDQFVSASSSIGVMNDLGGKRISTGCFWAARCPIWPVADAGPYFPGSPTQTEPL